MSFDLTCQAFETMLNIFSENFDQFVNISEFDYYIVSSDVVDVFVIINYV